MDSVDAEIAYLESLEPTENINYTQVAKTYGVDRSILSRQFCGIQKSQESQYEN